MQPTTGTLASSGAAGAAVIVLSWLASQFGHVEIPNYVQAALMILIAWGAGHVFHAAPQSTLAAKGHADAVILFALTPLGIVWMLSGCGTVNAAVSGATNYMSGSEAATKQNVQKADDLNLKSLSDAMCAVPYGAIVRNASGNPKVPAAVIDLCGLPQGVTIVTGGTTATIQTGTGAVVVPTSTTTVTAP